MIITSNKRPAWLNKKIDLNKCRDLDYLFSQLRLNTVCREAFCPNLSECFTCGVATFLILGRMCTRRCGFCAVSHGIPEGVDTDEPRRVAQAVKRLNLEHVVITSVTRDDLSDGGAGIFSDTIREIRDAVADIKIEVLVPDFRGAFEFVRKVVDSRPDVFGHNVETVRRLYRSARPQADFARSLKVLKTAKDINSKIFTKSGIMLGLGETEKEVLGVFGDLRKIGCDFLSIGQYLSPSEKHCSIMEYITPYKFECYKKEAEKLGFLHVESGPYVRSSYMASKYLKQKVTNPHST